MGKPIRVLHVITGMGSGGAESFIMNMYRKIDRDKVQFDFLLRSYENIYEDELKSMGSRIFITAPVPKQWPINQIQTKNILSNNHFDVIHVHANALYYLTALKEAKKIGIPVRIMHSHSDSTYRKELQMVHEHNKKSIDKWVTHRFACSDEAGKWMFGDNYTVIPNAVDFDLLTFSQIARRTIRDELGLTKDQMVLGQIGRLYENKNQKFSVDVLKCILDCGSDAVLLFVGSGNMKAELEEYAESLNVLDHIRFLGVRKDVDRLLSAFDYMLLPSHFEGLPLTMLEAQANGLPVLCSEAIPDRAIIQENVARIPLELGASAWASCIMNQTLKRVNNTDALVSAGFSVQQEAKELEDFYCTAANEV